MLLLGNGESPLFLICFAPPNAQHSSQTTKNKRILIHSQKKEKRSWWRIQSLFFFLQEISLSKGLLVICVLFLDLLDHVVSNRRSLLSNGFFGLWEPHKEKKTPRNKRNRNYLCLCPLLVNLRLQSVQRLCVILYPLLNKNKKVNKKQRLDELLLWDLRFRHSSCWSTETFAKLLLLQDTKKLPNELVSFCQNFFMPIEACVKHVYIQFLLVQLEKKKKRGKN